MGKKWKPASARSAPPKAEAPKPAAGPSAFWTRWRKNLLAGLVVVLPLYLTYWIISSSVALIDSKAERFLPDSWNLQSYIDVPGFGLLIFVIFTALLGAMARNIMVAQVVSYVERMLDRLPIVRSLYNGIKQIAETLLVQSDRSFERACLVEYPRKGIWAIAFISTETLGEVRRRATGEDMMSVFLPTTPNPTSGFLLFVPKEDVIELEMSVEEAAKVVISAGLVSPNDMPASPPVAAGGEAASGGPRPEAVLPAAQ